MKRYPKPFVNVWKLETELGPIYRAEFYNTTADGKELLYMGSRENTLVEIKWFVRACRVPPNPVVSYVNMEHVKKRFSEWNPKISVQEDGVVDIQHKSFHMLMKPVSDKEMRLIRVPDMSG